ncbi:long-subunit fatty acid transport protein [Acetobacteroides hydrogenigenes]|uniref:Long-subunit fatty acid transport protein n=2 Tax=Acetobacteroides hydrogenigenes TaxID=979970 RepID=A0A4R2E1X8_9BACT|nr:long-subunit fatty acid transport protein [Acetobacteroides hydrogenigenes]
MFKRTLRTSFLILFGVFSLIANAQEYSKNFYSPNTIYGIGQLSLPGFSNTRGMGDAGIGLRSRFMINHLNPAALTAQDTTTFIVDFGIESNNIYASTSSKNTSFNGFSVDHISMAFPISKRLFTALTFQPMTQVGYRVTIDETDPKVLANIGNVSYEYNGKGGINIGQIGLGAKIIEGLSVGANLNLYFGSIDRNYNTVFPATNSLYLSTSTASKVMVSNFGFSTGVSYAHKISKEKFLNFGLIYQPKLNISAKYDELTTVTSNPTDTIKYLNKDVSFGIPTRIGIGASYGKTDRYAFSFDYEFAQWNKVTPLDKMSEYVNTNSVRAGFEITPNILDFRNYFNRVTYRVGLRYNDVYYKVKGNKTNDIAVTAGFAFPIKGLSYLNTSFEFGKRGTKVDGSVKENYFTFTVGVSLFDRWFLKPMFD